MADETAGQTGTLKTEYRRNKNLRNCQEENFRKKGLEKTEEKTSEEDGVRSVYK